MSTLWKSRLIDYDDSFILILKTFYKHFLLLVLLLSTHSLDYCLWGESDNSAFVPPASLSITPAGSVHKPRGDSVLRMWVQFILYILGQMKN